MTEQELKASVLAKCREVWNNETNDPKVSGFRVHSNSGKYWDVHNYRRTVHYKLSDDIPADDNVWPLAAQILVIQAAKDKEVAELKAEIKRLRDALVWLKNNRTPDRAMIEVFIDKALSPAPVTEWKFPELIQSDVLPPNHFMGMGDDGKPFIGEISTGNLRPVTEKDKNVLPTDDEIHFVAVDESNADRHGWISLNQKPAYVDGFEDGAKWMRNKKIT